MAFTSTLTYHLGEFILASEGVTLKTFFRCGADRRSNAMIIQETDDLAAVRDEVAIPRTHVRHLLTALLSVPQLTKQ